MFFKKKQKKTPQDLERMFAYSLPSNLTQTEQFKTGVYYEFMPHFLDFNLRSKKKGKRVSLLFTLKLHKHHAVARLLPVV